MIVQRLPVYGGRFFVGKTEGSKDEGEDEDEVEVEVKDEVEDEDEVEPF